MSDHEATARVLQDAAAIIERDGWVQGAWSSDRGYCAVGAMNKAMGADDLAGATCYGPRSPYEALCGAVGVARIAGWNDAPGRTKQEVLDALHLAAKAELRLADEAAAS